MADADLLVLSRVKRELEFARAAFMLFERAGRNVPAGYCGFSKVI
jgi:hypothetical protein